MLELTIFQQANDYLEPQSHAERSQRKNLFHAISYSCAALKGAKHGLEGLVQTLEHPMDNVVVPMSTLLYDAAVIYAAHNGVNNLAAPDDHRTLGNYVLQNQPIYVDAMQRMQTRLKNIRTEARASGKKFSDGDGVLRAEMMAEGLTTIFAPGFILKGAVAASTMLQNARTFGTLSKPPLFHNIVDREVISSLPKFDLLDAKQVTSTLGRENFIFVYTADQKLLLTQRQIPNGHGKTFLYHHELAGRKPVFFAGELNTYDGHILSIIPKSGHYLPEGAHLGSFMEQVFHKHGYLEAFGTFKPIQLLGKSILSPRMTQESFHFMPGVETLATTGAYAARQSATLGFSQPIVEQLKQAKNVAEFLKGFDKPSRNTIKSSGSPADRSLLSDIESLEAYQDQTSQKYQDYTTKMHAAANLQDKGFALGQAAMLAGRSDNPGLGSALNALSGIASAAAGITMISANVVMPGVGLFLVGANTLIASMDKPEDDNSAQMMFELLHQLQQDIFDLKELMIKMNHAMALFLMREFNTVYSELSVIQQLIHHQGHQGNLNDAFTHSGIDLLIEQHQKDTLVLADSYGEKRPSPLSALTLDKHLELMPKLYQLTKESFARYHNGLTLYKAENAEGTRAAVAKLYELPYNGQMYGYMMTQWEDLKNEAHQVFNPLIWLEAVKQYIRLGMSTHPYDKEGLELQQIIYQGEQFMASVEKMEPRVCQSFEAYYSKATEALEEMEALLRYSEKMEMIANNPMVRSKETRELLKSTSYKGWYTPGACPIHQAFFDLDDAVLGTFKIWREFNWLMLECPDVSFKYLNGDEVRLTQYFRHDLGHSWVEEKKIYSHHDQRAIDALNHVRQNEMQEKINAIAQHAHAWENHTVFSMIKARGACIAIGINTSLCNNITTFAFDENALSAPFKDDLRQAKYMDALPTHQTLKSDLSLFKAAQAQIQPLLAQQCAHQLNPTRWITLPINFDITWNKTELLSDYAHNSYYIWVENNTELYYFDKRSQALIALPILAPHTDAFLILSYIEKNTTLLKAHLENITRLTDHTPPILRDIFSSPTIARVHHALKQLRDYQKIKQTRLYNPAAPQADQKTLQDMLQELFKQNQEIRQENQEIKQLLHELRDKATIYVDALTPFNPLDWNCEADSERQNIAICVDPAKLAPKIFLQRLVAKPWETLAPNVNECVVHEGIRICEGDDIRYFTQEKSTPTPSCPMYDIGVTAANGALSTAIPELIGDLFWLYGHTSKPRAEDIKWFVSLSMMLLIGYYCSNDPSTFYGLKGLALTWMTTKGLTTMGISESNARKAGSAVGFIVNTRLDDLTTGVGITKLAVHAASRHVGFWAEKQLVGALANATGSDELIRENASYV